MPRIQFSLDGKNVRVARVSHWKMDKGYARISLLSSARHDPDLMTSVGHQASMMSQDTFHSPHDRRGRVMEEGNFCH
jgi:hypothetical protein